MKRSLAAALAISGGVALGLAAKRIRRSQQTAGDVAMRRAHYIFHRPGVDRSRLPRLPLAQAHTHRDYQRIGGELDALAHDAGSRTRRPRAAFPGNKCGPPWVDAGTLRSA